ncbi:MAG: hypothetical protein J5896_02180 [Alphaproteobacteria bacterium]|nr:hypothetical protein [Alphaproteobacteria bacterium]
MINKEQREYLIVTKDEAYHVNSIEEAIYACGIKCATVLVPNRTSKKSYKYMCTILIDEDNDE